MADPYFKFVTAQFRAPTPGKINIDSSIYSGWFVRPGVNLRGNSPTISNEQTFGNSYCFKFVKPQVLCLEQSVDYGVVPCEPARFASSDFTIELEVRAVSISAGVCLIECWTSTNGWQIFINTNGTIQLKERNLAISLISLVGGPLFTINTNHHVALTRTGSVLRLFLNGANIAETTLLTSHTWTTAAPATVCVGGQFNTRLATYDLDGYVDNVRITKGVSRYTANFTPPIATDFEEYNISTTGRYYTLVDNVSISYIRSEPPFKDVVKNDPLKILNDVFVGALAEGDGEIYDVISVDDIPTVRKASLIERDSKILVRQVTSGPDGIFHIKNINRNFYYMLIGEDNLASVTRKNAAIRDFVRCIPKIIITKKPSSVTEDSRSTNYEIRAINFTVPVVVTLSSPDDVTFSSSSITISPQNKVGYFNILSPTPGNKTITITNNVNSNNPEPIVVAVASNGPPPAPSVTLTAPGGPYTANVFSGNFTITLLNGVVENPPMYVVASAGADEYSTQEFYLTPGNPTGTFQVKYLTPGVKEVGLYIYEGAPEPTPISITVDP